MLFQLLTKSVKNGEQTFGNMSKNKPNIIGRYRFFYAKTLKIYLETISKYEQPRTFVHKPAVCFGINRKE